MTKNIGLTYRLHFDPEPAAVASKRPDPAALEEALEEALDEALDEALPPPLELEFAKQEQYSHCGPEGDNPRLARPTSLVASWYLGHTQSPLANFSSDAIPTEPSSGKHHSTR